MMLRLALVLIVMSMTSAVRAGEALVAAATNFSEVLEEIAPRFEAATGHTLRIATGSSGKLTTQILLGAPYDVFLSADTERPDRLIAEGAALAQGRVTYALGRLALWSRDPERITGDGAVILRRETRATLAMANPELAPFGRAAQQTLQALGLADAFAGRIVLGENVGQAFAFVATGRAELGFVALSYVRSPRNRQTGSHWVVPDDLHDPIRQDAVLTVRGQNNMAARAFLAFLSEEEARTIIRSFAYDLPGQEAAWDR